MSKWQMVRLGDVLEQQPKSKIKAGDGNSTGKYRFFTSSNAQTKWLDNADYNAPSVIFGTGGNASVHFCNEPFSTSTDCLVFTGIESNLKSIYLYLCNHIYLLEEGFKGAGLKHISKDHILNIHIPLPPLSVQHKIADVLDKANALIEKRKEQLAKLDLLVKSQFIEMFGNPVTNPMGWEMKRLGDTCEIITGNTPPRANPEYYGDYIEWIKTDNIQATDSKLKVAVEGLSEQGFTKCRFVEANSILMTCIAGSLNSIGNVAITDRRVAFNQQINALIPKTYDCIFLYSLLKAMKCVIHESVNMMLKGILSKGSLTEIEAILPPLSLQNEFAEFVRAVEQLKSAMQKALGKQELLYKSLMQKCFNGEMF